MGLERLDHNAAEALAARVRSAFPELHFEKARLEDAGGDYRVLVLDGRYAFRFPRRRHHVGLRHEIAVLRALQRRCAIPTPEYRFVDPAFRFAGYRFIEGEPLTPELFAKLDQPARGRMAKNVGGLLKALHGLEPATIAPLESWPIAWTPAQFSARGLTKGVPLIARSDLVLAAKAEAFFDAYSREPPAGLVVVHGDLVSEHLLIDPMGEGLAGVIDFGDVSLGDPAQDFLGLWAYGRGAVAQALASYDPDGLDAGLLERSRRAWARHRIDRVWEALSREDVFEASVWADGLEALLDSV